MPRIRSPRLAFKDFAYALMLSAIAFAISVFVHPYFMAIPFTFPLAAVSIAALYFGFVCSLMVTAICTFFWLMYFIDVPSVLREGIFHGDSFRLLFFFGLSMLISIIGRRAHKDREEATYQKNRFIDINDHLDHTIVWEAEATDLSFLFVGGNIRYLLGYEPEEWMRLGPEVWKRLVVEEDRMAMAKSLAHACRPHITYERFNHRLIAKDGSIHWFQTGFVLRKRERDLNRDEGYSLYGVSTEITPLVEMQERLDEARKVADSANQAKSTFLANMSHEIRTPMGVIQGFAELLSQEKSLTPEQRTWATTIERNAFALTAILNDILDLSRIDAGKLTVEQIEFDLSEVIEDVVTLLSLRAEGKNLAIRVLGLEDAPQHLTSDPTRIRQILMNLIGNAIKFTEHGEIIVDVRYRPDHGINGLIDITVSDTGVGISEEEQTNLFQPFSQADESTTRKFGGTGLGLVISKKLAKLLGGDLELLESAPGKGSKFCFFFDCGRPEAMESSEPSHRADAKKDEQYSLQGMRVLLVEDSKDNQLLLRRVLEGAGAKVAFANNGREGVDLALNHPFDLVLMDIQMPELDGNQATAYLRTNGFRKPIVALTAHAFSEDRDRSMATGFTGYVTKPIDKRSLIKSVHEFSEMA